MLTLKHLKTLRHISILIDHHQGVLVFHMSVCLWSVFLPDLKCLATVAR